MLLMMQDERLALSYILSVFTLQQSIPITIMLYSVNDRVRDSLMEELNIILPASHYKVFEELGRNAFLAGNHRVIPVTLDEAHQAVVVPQQIAIVLTHDMTVPQVQQFVNWIRGG